MFARSIAVAACILGLFACAGSEPASDGASSAEAASTSIDEACGSTFAQANDLYKQAVAVAKQHKIDACEGANGSDEGAYLSTIASKASASVSTCGDYSNIIKTSQWAAPIRDELKGTLILPVLTGDLQVEDPATGKTTFKGLATALAGVTLWGPAAGVYGNNSQIKFEADGKAKIGSLGFHGADTMYWDWTDTTYTIGEVTGDAIKITVGTTEYELREVFDIAPDFELKPVKEGEGQLFTAYISECEA